MTMVSAPIQQLLAPFNDTADALRPIVAQIFNVPELAGSANGQRRSKSRIEFEMA